MVKNNLFDYATSELSQDAFICYFLSFASKENSNKDLELTVLAQEFLKKCLPNDAEKAEKLWVTNIERQHSYIDVYVVVNDKYNLIIEDKTFTHVHGNQITTYAGILEGEGKSNIRKILYKIVEQAHPEPDAVNITRTDILGIFFGYGGKNNIVLDYIAYLKKIDRDVNAYKTTSLAINDWRTEYNHIYRGFFTHLIHSQITRTNDCEWFGWDYINNARKGFWGMWWWNIPTEKLTEKGLPMDLIDAVYLQIEDNIIAVKLSEKNDRSNRDVSTSIRAWLFNELRKINPELKKKNWHYGKHMTVGYIDYNYDNKLENNSSYKAAIKKMEDMIIEFSKMPVSYKR